MDSAPHPEGAGANLANITFIAEERQKHSEYAEITDGQQTLRGRASVGLRYDAQEKDDKIADYGGLVSNITPYMKEEAHTYTRYK